MIYTTVNELKHQLNIEDSFTGDTAILTMILNASEQAVFDFCNAVIINGSGTGMTVTLDVSGTISNVQMTGYTGMTGSTFSGICSYISTAVVQATYLLAAHLYTNRNIISYTQGFEIPYTLRFLLEPYKNFVIV
jgi:hypothetical protein